ncbi:4-hydroxyphenylpyruvate dioxygenase [Streptomyces silvensis]|uniref:4-hydroxyphenylpyruvate dioxygenase n=1 Tax=Streptomyces silvensis TaxID=1765722 RepID=UPI00099E4465|nr:4-hydroxyphenylpyruvate dioxygenase [Streptomyces silvensis]
MALPSSSAPSSSSSPPSPFDPAAVDHVELFTPDLRASQKWLERGYGFRPDESVGAAGGGGGCRSVGLRSHDICLVLTEATASDHPAAAYTDRHGEGVGCIALRVRSATEAFEEAVRRGARPVAAPTATSMPTGTTSAMSAAATSAADGAATASIVAFGDVVHTFVERPRGAGISGTAEMPGTGETTPKNPGASTTGLTAIDHIAVCLEPGHLEPTVEFYQRVLDFRAVYSERVVVGSQAMDSTVVRSACGGTTLTLIEPDTSRRPGQIDAYLKEHRGSGVQHIAFATDDIVRPVSATRAAGVRFLSTPRAYYDGLAARMRPLRHSVDELRAGDVLADEDSDGQLFQIFTRSVHPRGTFFLELIERRGARTFGSGNIKALYEAVEHQQAEGQPVIGTGE